MGYQSTGKSSQLLNIYENKPKEGTGPFSTIIVFMHAYGLDDPMKKVIDDLATAGYYAVGVDSYLNGTFTMQTRSEDAIFQSFHVLMHWLKGNSLVNMDKLGAIGFCMGGRHAYMANTMENFKAVVSFYGFPHRGVDAEQTPVNRINDFRGPVLSIFGGKDQGIPPEAVKAYQDATQGSVHKTIVYEEADHGFLNPFSPKRHHPEASVDAWKKAVEWFDQYLK